MTLAEATRQYQAVLEASRAHSSAVEGLVAFEGERDAAARDVGLAEAEMFAAWLREAVLREGHPDVR
jgi:hypothetical protein